MADKVGILSSTSFTTYPLLKPTNVIDKAIFSKDGKVVLLWEKEHGLYLHKVLDKTPRCSKLGWVDTDGQSLVSSCELDFKGVILFVLLFTSQSQSTVAIVSQSSGQLIQSILVPLSVTSLCGINETSFPGLFNMATLQHFSGSICLGCEGGSVFVLDLGLEQLVNQPKATIAVPRGCRRIHITSLSIITQMKTAANNNEQLGLNVNSQYIKSNVFHYTDPADKLLLTCDEAYVSSLLYVHQFCSILIGYSFGGFQIFSFYDNNILFTFPLSLKHPYPPITHFTFQEPENDPKPYVYVWVARNGHPAQGKLGSSPTLTLFQLGFQQRLEDQGVVYYLDMEACIQRFEHLLWPNPYTSAVMVSCSTIERKLCINDFDNSFSKPFAQGVVTDRTLAVFVCQSVNDQDSTTTSGLVMVFDLNQWYYSQMPVFAKWNSTGNRKSCSFISLYEITSESGELLDSRVTSVHSFNSCPPVPETHLWPESLTIELKTITQSCISSFKYDGIQVQTLDKMMMFGSDVLLDVQGFISMCLSTHLLESPSGDHHHDLLSVALQYRLKSVLIAIAKSVQNPGFTLSAGSLLDWVKEKVTEITTEKSKILKALTTSVGTVDQYLLSGVKEAHEQLSLILDIIVELYQTQSIPEDALTDTYHLACIHSEVYQTAHWCMENGLLPHSYDTDHTPSCHTTFIFPIDALRKKYSSLSKNASKLAVDVLIEAVVDDDGSVSEFTYPPEHIGYLLQTKMYPPSISRHCLDLYLLYDVSNDERSFVQSYCDYFSIPMETMQLALSVWNVDHGTISVGGSKLLSTYYPAIYELGIDSLIEKDKFCKAIQCCTMSQVSCPTLLIQAMVNAGHVQKAFVMLTSYEGSCEYKSLMEQFVDCCLKSPYYNHLKKLQLSLDQLTMLCDILKCHGSQRAVQLSLALLLLHQCNMEAIALARDKSKDGGQLVECLAHSSNLLPSVKETVISSDELVKQMNIPIGPPQTLSTVMPRSKEHQFSSQVDVMVAVSQKIAEARQMKVNPVTPLRKTTSIGVMPEVTKLNDSISSSVLREPPFTSSPILFTNRSKRLRETPLVHSSQKKLMTTAATPQKSMLTPTKTSRETGKFKAYMEGFQKRMDKLNMMAVDKDVTSIQTPYAVRIEQTPAVKHTSTPDQLITVSSGIATATSSILKSSTTRTKTTITSEVLTSTSRKIRFQVDDSFDSVAKKPLPESDDSDGFYSPVNSPPIGKMNLPDVDEPAANVVIATKSTSFIASAEDEQDRPPSPSELSPLKQVYKSPSKILEGLTRSKILSQDGSTSSSRQFQREHSATASIKHDPPATDTSKTGIRSTSSNTRRKATPTSKKRSTNSSQSTKKYSSVMVNLKQDEAANYTFSPPQTVAMVTPTRNEPSQSSNTDFIFSPPLLRSANREKKITEFTKTGVEKGLDDSTSSTMSAMSSKGTQQQKRVRRMKTVQATPRRSERLLRSSKK